MITSESETAKRDDPKQDDPFQEGAETAADAAVEDKKATKAEQLDEGLEESFPGSNTPASTRRSSTEPSRPATRAEDSDLSEQRS